MPSQPTTANLDALLDNADWLKRLARRLVLDPSMADDLMQEVWVSALRFQGEVVSDRGWLRTVLIQKLTKVRETERSRRFRERQASHGEAEGDAPSTLERSQKFQEVHSIVHGLDERYREVLLLRFFEDLPPREIAKRTGIPVNTVLTRGSTRKFQCWYRDAQGSPCANQVNLSNGLSVTFTP